MKHALLLSLAALAGFANASPPTIDFALASLDVEPASGLAGFAHHHVVVGVTSDAIAPARADLVVELFDASGGRLRELGRADVEVSSGAAATAHVEWNTLATAGSFLVRASIVTGDADPANDAREAEVVVLSPAAQAGPFLPRCLLGVPTSGCVLPVDAGWDGERAYACPVVACAREGVPSISP